MQKEIDDTANKIADKVKTVSDNCDATSGPCASEITKMKNAAAALRAKLETATSGAKTATTGTPATPATPAPKPAAPAGGAGGAPATPAAGAGTAPAAGAGAATA